MDVVMCAADLETSEDVLTQVLEATKDDGDDDDDDATTAPQWAAAELSRKLQNQNSRVGSVAEAMQESLEKYAVVRNKFPIQEVPLPSSGRNQGAAGQDESAREIHGVRGSPAGSNPQRATKPQIQWMMEQIHQVIISHPAYGQRKLQIVDIGGG